MEQHEIDLIKNETKQREDTEDYDLMNGELDDSVGVELLMVKENFEKIVKRYGFDLDFVEWVKETL